MSFVSDFVSNVVGSVTGQKQAAQAAKDAASTQGQYAQAGIDEQRRQFDALVKVMSPYVEAGVSALGRISPYEEAGAGQLGTLGQYAGAGSTALQQQQALTGALGPEAQAAAISSIEQSPQMQAMIQQGENAMLQNASATGGLRGGNIQAAMAQFRPQILSGLIDQQYGRLGGLSSMGGNVAQNLASLGSTATQNIAQLGQASAAGTGAAGLESASAIGTLLGQQGAATAGGQLAYGQQAGQRFGTAMDIAGAFSGVGGISGIKKLF
jgi:hypothetical protein